MTWSRYWRRGLDFARVYRVARLTCSQLVRAGQLLPEDVDDVVQLTVADVAAHDADTNDAFVSLVARRRAWSLPKRDLGLSRRYGSRFDPLVFASDVLDHVEGGAGDVPPMGSNTLTRRLFDAFVARSTPSHESFVVDRVSFGEVARAFFDDKPSRVSAEPPRSRQSAEYRRRHFVDFGRRFVARQPRASARN
jgi:hypothetical protein